ncbi:hypothetical protein [Paenibacillus xylaniclasticus]|uniref:hypothetical protein n=1 Tax=Paenibacillus xylaniclasticus TaxID=588083 RepID=UPI000FD9E4DE|nr:MULTISPECIES: hypothetical protein [Paenibacillus]GFN30822.1 hypothetical protein PCURB6_10820 [Paenibacillus curdlanolyticus]
MASVYLHEINMTRESKSFTDALHAILTAAGLFEGPKYMLSGLTGMAFKFAVHEQLLPMSVTAYGGWGTEHRPGVDNLGIWTVDDGGRTRHPTFRYYQQDAVRWMKRFLDQGIGLIYWIPEFGVIRGYDDDDGVFYVQNGWSEDDEIVLYDNMGINYTPFWHVQAFGERVEVPFDEQVLESVRLAIHDWDTPFKLLPSQDIASGKLAYTFLRQGLESGRFDESGARYIIDSFCYSRLEIKQYLADVRTLWPELEQAYSIYAELADNVSDLSLDSGVDQLVNRIRIAEDMEDRAVHQFRQLSDRYPDQKRTLVPRWGSTSAR